MSFIKRQRLKPVNGNHPHSSTNSVHSELLSKFGSLHTKKKMLLYDNTDNNEVWPETYQSEDPSVPATSKTSYPSSSWKSMKTRAIVSPGSARIVHVQSALLPYSKGKWGLEIIPLCPLKVPPQASSAANKRMQVMRFCWNAKSAMSKKKKKAQSKPLKAPVFL